jgi:diacylglycerol kinase family enzyme
MPAQELQVDGETLGKLSEVRSVIVPQAINVISIN